MMEVIFIFCLFVVAYLYASVGHGGASGYLALMALFGVMPEIMRPSALILNLFVSLIAFVLFMKGGFLKLRLLLPFVIASVPFSFLGAWIDMPHRMFNKILAVCLLLAAVKMLLPYTNNLPADKKPHIMIALFSGGLIGFVSGLIGIGGGILLSPLLILNRWATIKESAAVASAFIFLNSSAALAGLSSNNALQPGNQLLVWIPVALLGGAAGSFMGSYKLSYTWLKYMLCFILVLASVKLLVQ